MSTQLDLTFLPNLETRESVMLAAGRVQFSLINGEGQTVYVKVECKAKDLPDSDKRYTAVPLDQATHVFISEQGYNTPKLGTYYPPKSGYKSGRLFTDLQPEHPSLKAIYAIAEFVCDGVLDYDSEFDVIEVESACGLCGRKLIDPVSTARGIGPECAGKPTGTKILHASAFVQQEFPVAEPNSPEASLQAYKDALAKAEAARDQAHAALIDAENEVARLARECEKSEFYIRETTAEMESNFA